MAPAAPAPRQSGIALLIVLVVLFIVAVLMVDVSLTATTARRAAHNASSAFLMDAAIEAHFQVAVAQLQYDLAEDPNVDGLDDRWAREEYTKFQSKSASEKERGLPVAEEPEGARSLGDSDQVQVTLRIEDEERKFNLNLLRQADPAKQATARDRFAVLLDRFREGTPLDISRTSAEVLKDAVCKYLDRPPPAEGDKGQVPLPKTGAWRLLTPDELRNVEDFADTEHGMPAEGILYDAREPRAVQTWKEDPDNQSPPEVYRGLLHYVTLWSGSAWVGQAAPDTWLPINLNTAEKPVLETLFWKNPQDFPWAEKMIEYRTTEKEESKTATSGSGAASGEESPLAQHQVFKGMDDVKKIEGLTDTILTANAIASPGTAAFKSGTFSIDILAEMDQTSKQVRYVVRRNAKGIQTLLREERADPRFEAEKKPGEEEPAPEAPPR